MYRVADIVETFPCLRTREACQLLTLLPGSGILLREVMLGSVKGSSNSCSDAEAETALRDVGVRRLTKQNALAVLMRRVDWPQSTLYSSIVLGSMLFLMKCLCRLRLTRSYCAFVMKCAFGKLDFLVLQLDC